MAFVIAESGPLKLAVDNIDADDLRAPCFVIDGNTAREGQVGPVLARGGWDEVEPYEVALPADIRRSKVPPLPADTVRMF